MPHHHGLPAEQTHEVADGGLILGGMHRVGGVGRGGGIRVGGKRRKERRCSDACRASTYICIKEYEVFREDEPYYIVSINPIDRYAGISGLEDLR